MGVPRAFLSIGRTEHGVRPASEATHDYDDFVVELHPNARMEQASRCMNCGVGFCQSGMCFNGARRTSGCPLHNLIPETNDLLCRGRWDEAAARLSLTNPFPEFTGHVCPAPCEVACNLGQHDEPVSIHDNERAIAEHQWKLGVSPLEPAAPDAPLVSVVGSGPAGLAAAWVLARRGIRVRVYERDDRPGGLLMYGIPNMKLPKDLVTRRIDLMKRSGIEFVCDTDATTCVNKIKRESSAIVLAIGSRTPRGVHVSGSELGGIHYAVDYLSEATRALLDGRAPTITAEGKDVAVIGGGDTGVDCVAIALRQGARSVRQIVRARRAPDPADAPSAWPAARNAYSQGYGQREASELFGEDPRLWATDTTGFVGDRDGNVSAVLTRDLLGLGEEREVPAQLVLIAKGFVGPEQKVLEAYGANMGVKMAFAGGRPVYIAGDAHLGSSIVASAMADAMETAHQVADDLLKGKSR